jgi:hypothetical protein
MAVFSTAPVTLSAAEQHQWHERILQAQHLAGLTASGVVQVTEATLDLLQRYVVGELTIAQVVRLQSQRLTGH